MRAVLWSPVALLIVVAACGGEDANVVPGDGNVTPQSTVCSTEPVIELASPVAEARSKLPFTVTIQLRDTGGMRGAHPLKVVLTKDGSPVRVLSEAAHEPGRIAISVAPSVTKDLETGRYAITATAGCPTGATQAKSGDATAPLFLVRLGVTSLDVQPGDGMRVPLMYHAVDRQYGNVYPITTSIISRIALPASEPELDDAQGNIRGLPKPWDDLDSPPVDANGAVVEDGLTLPVSLRVGTKPDIAFRIAKTAAGPRGAQSVGVAENGAPQIRIVVDGGTASDQSIVRPGETAIAGMGQSPVPSVNRFDETLAWHFEAKTAEGAWVAIPGAIGQAAMRWYGVLGNSQGTLAPNLPWVAVVDAGTKAVKGSAADAAGVRRALVKYVYEDLALGYDRAQGASHYTAYIGGAYSRASFRLARFLKRDYGTIVNCTDCASILSSYANMLGADLKYTIILAGFDLNPILGIGATDFGSPFNSGRMAFSYHAVTSPDAAQTIYDATLAVDGDADPTAAPHAKKLVQGIPGSDYLDRLSGDTRARYTHVDKDTSISF